MRRKSDDAAIGLAVALTKWNLGLLIMLALAFGGGLWGGYVKISNLDKKISQTNYILALALGLVPGREPSSENRQDHRDRPETRSIAAPVAVAATVDSLAEGSGRDPARSGASSPQPEGVRNHARF